MYYIFNISTIFNYLILFMFCISVAFCTPHAYLFFSECINIYAYMRKFFTTFLGYYIFPIA